MKVLINPEYVELRCVELPIGDGSVGDSLLGGRVTIEYDVQYKGVLVRNMMSVRSDEIDMFRGGSLLDEIYKMLKESVQRRVKEIEAKGDQP